MLGATDTGINFIKFITNFCYKIDILLIHEKRQFVIKPARRRNPFRSRPDIGCEGLPAPTPHGTIASKVDCGLVHDGHQGHCTLCASVHSKGKKAERKLPQKKSIFQGSDERAQ